MSLPSFPVSGPPIEREDAVNQILSSIAMEEPGLGHILNAEGERLQYILGTLPGLSGPPATVGDVLAANDSVRGMLETAAQNQLFLKTKMQKALTASPMQGPAGPAGAAGPGLTSAFPPTPREAASPCRRMELSSPCPTPRLCPPALRPTLGTPCSPCLSPASIRFLTM